VLRGGDVPLWQGGSKRPPKGVSSATILNLARENEVPRPRGRRRGGYGGLAKRNPEKGSSPRLKEEGGKEGSAETKK